MTRNLKALSKQLFGARYERIGKSLWSGFFLFFALYTAEIRLTVAPFILFLTSAVFTAGIMWQVLNASHNAEILQGFFLLPFESRELTMPFVLVFGGYTLITKTVPVWAVFFAVSEWSVSILGVIYGIRASEAVLLEWLRPIRDWKVESDIWHHPRKYIVPLLMMLIAAVVGTWPPLIWIWLDVLAIECIGLLFIARRI